MSYWRSFLSSPYKLNMSTQQTLSFAAYGMVVKEGEDPDNPSDETKQKIAEELRPLAEELSSEG